VGGNKVTMTVKFGEGKTEYGPGIDITLTGEEVAIAIETYLLAHGVYIRGPRTIRVNGELCESGEVYIDPSGFAMVHGTRYDGR
jgi:hypothetical protein